MSIYKTVYETDAMSGNDSRINRITEKLQILRMNGYITPLTKQLIDQAGALEVSDGLDLGVIRLIVGNNDESSIESFEHPIVLTTAAGEIAAVVIDVRPFIKRINSIGEWTIRVPFEFNFMVLRAVLTYLWVSGEQRHIQSLSRLPCMLFSRWIADSISRRFGLNPETQMNIAVVAAIHYIKLFSDDEVINTSDKVRTVGIISAATNMGSTMVEAILSQLEGHDTSLESLADAIVTIGDSARLEGFTKEILLTAVTGIWYGPSGRLTAAAALQHPPTWISMLLAAAIIRGFAQSGAAKLFYKTENKEVAQLLASVFGLLRE